MCVCGDYGQHYGHCGLGFRGSHVPINTWGVHVGPADACQGILQHEFGSD